MRRIPLTQDLSALVDDEDFEFLNQWTWHAHRQHRSIYAIRNRRTSDGLGPQKIRMHRVLLQPPDGLQPDHVNGDGLDNRRANLRAVTRGINQANRNRPNRGRTHDLPIGVYRSRRRFQAQIKIDGHPQYLGSFDTPEQAAVASQTAREERIATATHPMPDAGRSETGARA